MNKSIASTTPLGDRATEVESVASFTAKLASARGTRVYRVYLRRDDLFFIVLAEGLSASPETLTVHFGLLGFLIGAMMKKRAKKKKVQTDHAQATVTPVSGAGGSHASESAQSAAAAGPQSTDVIVTSPIVGASRPGQLDDAIAAVGKTLDPGLKTRLDALTADYRLGDDIR